MYSLTMFVVHYVEAHNVIQKSKPVTGIDNNCSICYDNKACVYFPECGHIPVCDKCAYELETKI